MVSIITYFRVLQSYLYVAYTAIPNKDLITSRGLCQWIPQKPLLNARLVPRNTQPRAVTAWTRATRSLLYLIISGPTGLVSYLFLLFVIIYYSCIVIYVTCISFNGIILG